MLQRRASFVSAVTVMTKLDRPSRRPQGLPMWVATSRVVARSPQQQQRVSQYSESQSDLLRCLASDMGEAEVASPRVEKPPRQRSRDNCKHRARRWRA